MHRDKNIDTLADKDKFDIHMQVNMDINKQNNEHR